MVTDEARSDEERLSPEEILKALDQPWTRYPRQLIQAAMDRRQEVTPLLLSYLQKLVRKMDAVSIEDPDSFMPVFCLQLLSYFREKQAHQLIADLATSPAEAVDELFGDLLTADLAAFLWMTSAGDDAAIKTMVVSGDVDDIVRAEAISALIYGVAEGVLERADVVQLIQSLLETEDPAAERFIVWSAAVSCLRDLHPGESMVIIRQAFANDLVDGLWVNLDEVEAAAERPLEEVMSALVVSRRAKLAMEPHERMGWWACFRSQAPKPREPDPLELKRKKNKEKGRRKRDAKRKMSKASKRGQR